MLISHSDRWSVLSGTSRQPLVKLLFNLWIQALHVGITLYFDLNTRFKLCAILGNKYPAKTSITLLRKSLSKLSPKGNACNLIWNKIPLLYISKEERVSSSPCRNIKKFRQLRFVKSFWPLFNIVVNGDFIIWTIPASSEKILGKYVYRKIC